MSRNRTRVEIIYLGSMSMMQVNIPARDPQVNIEIHQPAGITFKVGQHWFVECELSPDLPPGIAGDWEPATNPFRVHHASCPKMKDPEGPWPEMKWNGFAMAGMSDYECPLCGMSVTVIEE